MCTDARVIFIVNATEGLGTRPLDVASEALCAHVIGPSSGCVARTGQGAPGSPARRYRVTWSAHGRAGGLGPKRMRST
jgi:hypothetical protein